MTKREALRAIVLELLEGVPDLKLRGTLIRAITALELAALSDGNEEVFAAIERRAKAQRS